jgi:hypothetical protein
MRRTIATQDKTRGQSKNIRELIWHGRLAPKAEYLCARHAAQCFSAALLSESTGSSTSYRFQFLISSPTTVCPTV